MKTQIHIPRLLLELLVIIAAAEAAVMFILPVVAPDAGENLEAALDAGMLSLIVTPFLLWRVNAAVKKAQLQTADAGSRISMRQKLVLSLWVVIGLGMTVAIAYGSWVDKRKDLGNEFEHMTGRLSREIERQVNQIRYGLIGANGVINAMQGQITRDAFERYVGSRDLPKEFPGSVGIGLIERVPREGVDPFIERQRMDGEPEFTITSLAQPGTPLADDPYLYVVTSCYPREKNLEAFGLDEGSESIRREAIDRAIDTGNPAITGRLRLVQQADDHAAFLYFIPVYRSGADISTVKARREAAVALLYSPILLERSLVTIQERFGKDIDFEIYDGPAATAANRLYDRDSHFASVDSASGNAQFDSRAFHTTYPIEIGGREWTLFASSLPAYEAALSTTMPAIVGCLGAFLTLLMAGFVYMLMNGRAQAQELARAMTEDLRQAKQLAEEAAREAQGFRWALDHHSIISIADARGRIIDTNDRFCEISGYSREELLGKDHFVLNSGHHPKGFWREAWQQIRTGKSWHGEVCNRAKDGSLYWVDSIIAPFVNAEGVVERYVSIRNDITARKTHEMELKRLTSRLELATQAGGVGIWDYDVVAGELRWDAQMFALYGVDRASFTGAYDAWSSGVHPDDRARGDQEIQSALSGEKEFNTEFRIVWPDGTVRYIRAIAQVQRDEAGRALRMVGTNWDITDEVTHAKQLSEAQAKAEASNLAKSAFLANMSHEIRTPLTAILGFSDILRDEKIEPARRTEAINTINTAGSHLLTIINDILDLSKIDADKMQVEKVETPLLSLLHEVESLMRPRATGKGLKFETRLSSRLPDRIMSDPTRLRQILMNLVGNAIKFTEIGQVSVVAGMMQRNGRDELVIQVNDTGVGLTQEQAGRLFQAFGQANDSVTRKHGGTGLGLTICRRLAGLMGGNVVLAHSRPQEGSCFEISLPLEAATGAAWVDKLDSIQSSTDHAAQSASMPETLSGRILLAEDGPENQRLISFHLRKAGAQVEIAENGLVALTMIRKAEAMGQRYDLLLTDMQMPEMDGYSLSRTLRAQGSRMAIVALTAHAMAEDRAKCEAAGCDDYSTKPIDRKALLETCAKWIGRDGGASSLAQSA